MKTISQYIFYGLFIAAFGAGLSSCRKTSYAPGELIRYVQDTTSDFVRSKHIGDIHITVSYLPPAYNALMEMNGKGFSASEYGRLVKEYKNSHVFSVRLWCYNHVHPFKSQAVSKEEWYMRKKYFDFDVFKDVKLVQQNDTVDCSIHHHFYNDMGNALELMFVFDNEKTNRVRPLTFVYNDRMYGTGYLQFEFDNEVINFRPQIKI